MAQADAARSGSILVHPLTVRITHWVNVIAMLIMIFSGWRIYNASPVFPFKFPVELTLGGWLGGALQWHFAAMWVLAVNGLVYLLYGLIAGHFKANFLPLTPHSVFDEFKRALSGKISHQLGVYNAVQRAAYVGVIGVIVVLVLSGLVIWKPVQFQELGAVMGGFEGARILHFFAMSAVVLFIVVHVVMVALVPRTFLPMLTGHAKEATHGHGG
ncbi:MAG: thioredoxin reductase [Betaproteobacteria bacterium]|nr:thioredoxin reductase [Betaproteobacteria bacterium]